MVRYFFPVWIVLKIHFYLDFADIVKQDEQISIDFKSCVKTSKYLNMVSFQKISESQLLKWRFFQSRDVPMVSFETDEEVYILVEFENKEITVMYKKVTQTQTNNW